MGVKFLFDAGFVIALRRQPLTCFCNVGGLKPFGIPWIRGSLEIWEDLEMWGIGSGFVFLVSQPAILPLYFMDFAQFGIA